MDGMTVSTRSSKQTLDNRFRESVVDYPQTLIFLAGYSLDFLVSSTRFLPMRSLLLIGYGSDWSHRLLFNRCGGDPIWQWGSSVGCEHSKCNSLWPGTLLPVYGMTGCGGGCRAKELVGKRKRILLRRLNLHHEALDIAAIPADFCTESTGSSLLHCPVSDLVEPDFLFCHWILCIVPMHPKRKDLEPVGSW